MKHCHIVTRSYYPNRTGTQVQITCVDEAMTEYVSRQNKAYQACTPNLPAWYTERANHSAILLSTKCE